MKRWRFIAFILLSALPALAIDPPTGVSATDGVHTDKVQISWNAVAGAAFYEVWRSTEDDVSTVVRIANVVPQTVFADNTATASVAYWYWVKASDGVESSAFSDNDSGWRLGPPLPPANLSATDGTFEDKVVVTWDLSLGADTYEIWRATSDNLGQASLLVGSLGDTTTSYDDNAVVQGTTYYYWMRASSFTVSDFTDSALGRPRAVPDTPSNFTATDGTVENGITVSWTALPDADTYRLLRHTENDFDNADVLFNFISITSYTDNTVTSSTQYYYWVQARNFFGLSDPANDGGWALGVPQPPATVTASNGELTNRIELAWTDALNTTAFTIYRNTINQSASATAILTTNVFNYDDNDPSLNVEQDYYYWVRSESPTYGPSAFSDVAVGRIRGVPEPPAFLVADDGTSADHVTVSWGEVADASHYDLYRHPSFDLDNATLLVANLTTTTHNDTTAAAATEYYYWAVAANGFGDSTFSPANAGWRAGVPVAPEVTASNGDFTDRIDVDWPVVFQADAYQLWRGDVNDFALATSLVNDLTTNHYEDTTATPGTPYFYWVQARNGSGVGALSEAAAGLRSGLPAAPTNVTATAGTSTTTVTVAWDLVVGATQYEIWRHTTNDAAGATLIADAQPGPDYANNDTTAAVLYYYWVSAVNDVGSSSLGGPAAGWRDGIPQVTADVSASDGTHLDEILVTWTNSLAADQYDVWRNIEDNPATAVTVATGLVGTSFTDRAVNQGTTYYYWVEGISELGRSGLGTSDSGFPGAIVPVATDGEFSDRVEVRWASIVNAEFEIWRNTQDQLNTAMLLANENAGTAIHEDNTALAGVLYYYWIRPLVDGQAQDFSASDSGWRDGIPAPPAPIAEDGITVGAINVIWPAAAASSYELWRHTSNDSGAASLLTTTSALAYVDNAVVAGQHYYYWLKAINNSGTSGFGTSDVGWDGTAPVPSNVTASDGLADVVTVTWDDGVTPEQYELWRNSQNDSSSATMIATVVGTSHNDAPTAGVFYYYWVRATTAAETSAFSAANQGWRQGPNVTGLMVSSGTLADHVALTWDSMPGALSYSVWRDTDDDPAGAIEVTSAVATNDYSDTSANAVVLYHYWIRANYETGASDFGDASTGWRNLSPPGNLLAGDGNSDMEVSLTWDAVESATGYELWRSSSDSLATATRVEANIVGTNYNDNNLLPATPYHYWLRTEHALGVSDFGDSELGWLGGTLAAAGNFTTTEGTRLRHVALTWDAVFGADSYAVLRQNAAREVVQLASGVTATEFNDDTGLRGVVYEYQIQAEHSQWDADTTAWTTGFYSNSIRLQPEWNLLSAPVTSVQTIGSLFTTADLMEGLAWYWDHTHQQFAALNGNSPLVAQGQGYWVKSTTGGQPNAYIGVDGDNRIVLARGWTLAGPGVEGRVPTGTAVQVWRWDVTAQRYVLAAPNELLYPGYGYWFYSGVAVEIELETP